jgi:hypothetical protein
LNRVKRALYPHENQTNQKDECQNSLSTLKEIEIAETGHKKQIAGFPIDIMCLVYLGSQRNNECEKNVLEAGKLR